MRALSELLLSKADDEDKLFSTRDGFATCDWFLVVEILAAAGGDGKPSLLQRTVMSGWSMYSSNAEQHARLFHGYSWKLALTRPGDLQVNCAD